MPYKVSCTPVALFLICFLLATPAFPYANTKSADSKSLDIAKKFAQQGAIYYEQHDLAQALDYFSRALLLDIKNPLARENFLRISKETDMPGQKKMELYLLEDLLGFIDHARKKLATATEERDRLTDTLIQRTHKVGFIQRGLADIQERFGVPEQSWQLNNDSKKPLEALHAALVIEKERLSYELVSRQKQYIWLQKMQQQMERGMVLRPVDERRPEIAIGTVSSDPQGEITGLHSELGKVKEQLENLQMDMESKNTRIAELTKEIIEFSLKLAEKEMNLSEKVNVLSSLHETYADLQSRLALGQKIIEEKGIQIQSLEESLASLQEETATKEKEVNMILASKDKALGEWENVLVIYQGKLKEATRKLEASDSDIATLHTQLAATQTQLFQKETALEKVRNKLVALQDQLKPATSQDR